MNAPRTNRYAGPCNACGKTVPAETGILVGRMVGGSQRWLVRHTDCTAVRATVTRVPDAPGFATERTFTPADEAAMHAMEAAADREQTRREEFVRWVADLIHEAGSVDGGWSEYFMCNEGWDGEPDLIAAGRARFMDAARAAAAFDAAAIAAGQGRPHYAATASLR